eukprot:scaffold278860_cov35-Tisochrysis_lutea.AAC.2
MAQACRKRTPRLPAAAARASRDLVTSSGYPWRSRASGVTGEPVPEHQRVPHGRGCVSYA